MIQHAVLNTQPSSLSQRELELAAIIDAYNGVTERLKMSHEQLGSEVRRLREELSRKNRQLRRRERLAALGELAAGVAHEIRNPLGGIQVFASLLRRDLSGQSDALRLVDKITGGVSRLERIVTDILEFGRPCEPRIESMELRMVLAEVAELAMGKRPGGRVEVSLTSAVEGCSLWTDAAMLQRALLNLVLNGLEAGDAASPGAARVQIRADQAGGRVTIEILDNGPGVPVELHDRIFNPFFTTKQTGTGLGLAIVHQTIDSLGGTVTAGGRPEGGAIFTVRLPLNYVEREDSRIQENNTRASRGNVTSRVIDEIDADLADETLTCPSGSVADEAGMSVSAGRVTAAA